MILCLACAAISSVVVTTREGAAHLTPALRAAPSLQKLSLNNNHIGDAGLAALAPALHWLPSLTKLHLSYNDVGDEGLQTLLQPTDGLKSLTNVYLDRNQITDAGCSALASALRAGALPEVRVFDLSHNHVSRDALSCVVIIRNWVRVVQLR